MARSRVFDEETALDRAMNTFWRKGYETTSITDLTGAMEINKGSLYHSFGSKQELFVRVFLKYNQAYRRALLTRMSQYQNPEEAIAELFTEVLRQSLEDKERKGCFLVNTSLEMAHHTGEVQDLVHQGMSEFEAFFVEQLTRAKTQGAVSDDLDLTQVAKALLTLVVGMRVLARGVYGGGDLEMIRDQALRMLKP
ncbi:TetR/AcrR family transcriptional regulator [Pseudophaeobacter sp.]|uniref:TetR/AcrR family transcriptional regulator n=1 Tax=Pseudophaeobacter sp. TaxID=1971739 RepID=UPI003297FE94